MDQNSVSKISGNLPKATVTAPAIMSGPEDVSYNEPSQSAEALNTSYKICLEKVLEKLQLKSNSETCQVPQCIQTYPNSSYIQLQKDEKKGKVWLSDLLITVQSLSRTTEQEKFKNKTSIGSGNLLGTSINDCRSMPWLPTKNGKTYQDWRAVIIPEVMTPYTMLSNEEHQERLKTITKTKKFLEHQLSMKSEGRLAESKKHKKKHRRRAISIVHEKVRRIGPHLDIFEAFTQIKKTPAMKKAVAAATGIQKMIRGYLVRCKFKRVQLKAQRHGSTLAESVREYRKMMSRIKRRCGFLDLSTPLIYEQFEEWLDQKRIFESIFLKREKWKKMDINELPKFFQDCGLFPSLEQLNIAVKMVISDTESRSVRIRKQQAVEMAFMLYPPHGFKLKTAATAKSTWLRPVVDGEDGYRYIVNGHPALKAANIKIAGELVAASMRRQKAKNHDTASPSSLLSD